MGAVANNALGVAGVAGRVRLLGCKAIAGLDGHLVTSAAVRCLEYCASAGAHITSNSWGGQVCRPWLQASDNIFTTWSPARPPAPTSPPTPAAARCGRLGCSLCHHVHHSSEGRKVMEYCASASAHISSHWGAQ